jgi:outer membrane protein assembly factor BamB
MMLFRNWISIFLLAAATIAGAQSLTKVTVTPSSFVGGSQASGTVTLDSPAPVGGFGIDLTWDPSGVATGPTLVTIPAGKVSAQFKVSSAVVSKDTKSTLLATDGASTLQASFTVSAATVYSLFVPSHDVSPGQALNLTVNLNGRAPAAGLTVKLSSSNPNVTVPTSVLVAGGASSAQVQVTTQAVWKNASAVLTGRVGSATAQTTLSLLAPVATLVISPQRVYGGTASTGTVTLSYPAPTTGLSLRLQSSAMVVQVPPSVNFAPSATTATFTVTTRPVVSESYATITSDLGGSSTLRVLNGFASWPKARGDLQNSGHGIGTGIQVPKFAGYVDVQHNIDPYDGAKFSPLSSPVIGSDGVAYTLSTLGTLYAFNDSGVKYKRFLAIGADGDSVAGYIPSTPVISPNGTLYVGFSDSNLYSIDAATGTVNWVSGLSAPIQSSPSLGKDGSIYVGGDDGVLYSVSPGGVINWSFKSGGQIFSSPCVGPDGVIYFGSADHFIYAINPNGTVKWRFSTGGSVTASPSLSTNGVLYCGSGDGVFYVIQSSIGRLLWSKSLGGPVLSSAAVSFDGTVFVAANNLLYALNPLTGSTVWIKQTNPKLTIHGSPSVAADGTIYLPTDDFVYAITPDRTTLWKLQAVATPTGNDPYYPQWSSVAIRSDGTIFYSTGQGLFFLVK